MYVVYSVTQFCNFVVKVTALNLGESCQIHKGVEATSATFL